MYKYFFKRFIDIVISTIGILILLPVLTFVAVVMSIQSKKNPFFFQDRPGKNEKRIRIIKFKSMTDERDEFGDLLPDFKRITKLGNFIRSTSIDELPQLFNVLIGDMSLVGPRPLLFKYLPLYSKEQSRRHDITPGITGWAQVNGRNEINWAKKFELDVFYVDNVSFLLDCKIFWLTIVKVLKRESVNQEGSNPMEPFNGKN